MQKFFSSALSSTLKVDVADSLALVSIAFQAPIWSIKSLNKNILNTIASIVPTIVLSHFLNISSESLEAYVAIAIGPKETKIISVTILSTKVNDATMHPLANIKPSMQVSI